jgi:hypothetical protein
LTAYSLRNPCRFYFAPAALMGFTLRSFLLPQGTRPVVRTGWTHIPFHPPLITVCRSSRAGSASRGSWVLTLTRVPDDQSVFSAPAAGCSLGFFPLRATRKSLGRDFAQPPLTRFATRLASRRWRLRVSISSCLSSSFPSDLRRTGEVRHPLRVFAPGRSRSFELAALRAMCSPCVRVPHCCRLTERALED